MAKIQKIAPNVDKDMALLGLSIMGGRTIDKYVVLATVVIQNILLLGITEEMDPLAQQICARFYPVALFAIAKTKKQPIIFIE